MEDYIKKQDVLDYLDRMIAWHDKKMDSYEERIDAIDNGAVDNRSAEWLDQHIDQHYRECKAIEKIRRHIADYM